MTELIDMFADGTIMIRCHSAQQKIDTLRWAIDHGMRVAFASEMWLRKATENSPLERPLIHVSLNTGLVRSSVEVIRGCAVMEYIDFFNLIDDETEVDDDFSDELLQLICRV